MKANKQKSAFNKDAPMNGKSPPMGDSKIASMEGLFAVRGSGGHSPTMEVLKQPDNMAELSARTRLDMEEIEDICNIVQGLSFVETGDINIDNSIKINLQLRASEKGQRIQDAIRMESASAPRMARRGLMGMFGNAGKAESQE